MSTTPRAQQRASSRAAILDAAISVYGDGGPNGAPLRDVADAAGVTHPLILQYFGSKDGLLAAVGDRLVARVTTEIEAVGSCDAESFARLLRAARNEPSMTKLLIRSALGDIEPDGFPACLGEPWPLRGDGVDSDADRRAKIFRYAASSILLGWLTFDGFIESALRLGSRGRRRRDDAIAAVAAHMWAFSATDDPLFEFSRIADDDPGAREVPSSTEPTTRDALLASAIELFAQHGPASVSIRDVARHAGMNHGLLHRHFGSKDALIAEALEVGIAPLMPGARAPGGLDIDQVVAMMHRDPIPSRLIARTLVDDIDMGSVRVRYPVMEGVLDRARRAPVESRPACVADPGIAAAATGSMVAGSVIWGASLCAASGFEGDVQPALTDLSHHLLGVHRG